MFIKSFVFSLVSSCYFAAFCHSLWPPVIFWPSVQLCRFLFRLLQCLVDRISSLGEGGKLSNIFEYVFTHLTQVGLTSANGCHPEMLSEDINELTFQLSLVPITLELLILFKQYLWLDAYFQFGQDLVPGDCSIKSL